MTNISVADNMFDQAGRDGYRNLSVFLPDNFGSNASTTTMVSMFSQCGFNHIQFGNNFAPHGTTMEKMF